MAENECDSTDLITIHANNLASANGIMIQDACGDCRACWGYCVEYDLVENTVQWVGSGAAHFTEDRFARELRSLYARLTDDSARDPAAAHRPVSMTVTMRRPPVDLSRERVHASLLWAVAESLPIAAVEAQ